MNIRPVYLDYLSHMPEYHTWVNDGLRTRAVVMVDNRDDPIRNVIASFQRFLEPSWNFYHLIPPPSFGPDGFNQLLLTPSFWDFFLREDIILLIQGDTVCLRPLDPRFEQYAMIGAPCGLGKYDEPFTMNGGLSLRNRQAMVRALADRKPCDLPEDVFFTKTLRELGEPVPSYEECCAFSVESDHSYQVLPFGVHGTDKDHHTDELAALMVANALY